ncbi:MAG: lysophospholipid acyltransferase family protein [Rickettsiales bacterium]|nr:lysophospholipid acyltransferase family protein [Rickettsiales bacterium]
MNIISSFLFWIFISIWSTIIPIIFLPLSIAFRSQKIADDGAKIWAEFSLWFLKKICRIDYQIIGLENLPKEACIIACKHQSMWETIVMHLIFKYPVYAFKKELLKIPFYGWFLRKMSGIIIDRSGGASALKELIKQSKKYLSQNQTIILFPQGTRVDVLATSEKYPYQAGIAALYLSCNVKVVPAALNSGLFFPKDKFLKAGKITLEFLDAINPGLSKQEFMLKLEEAIEQKSKNLIEAKISKTTR